jgi:hypothetical protein
VPNKAELVVYDPDSDHAYARFKIGDGENFVTDLPFAGTEELAEELADALADYVTLGTNQTITGKKVFNAPKDVSKTETTTVKFKTSNGGAVIFGKEGTNSATMMRLD